MRLIDADALKGRFIHGRFDDVYISEKEVQDAPTVDAVEVVRCRDCRYYAADKDRPPRGFCMPLHINSVDDWYCADGERKDDVDD